MCVPVLPTRLLFDDNATAPAPQPVVPLPQVTAPRPAFHRLLLTTKLPLASAVTA